MEPSALFQCSFQHGIFLSRSDLAYISEVRPVDSRDTSGSDVIETWVTSCDDVIIIWASSDDISLCDVAR